MKSIQEHTALIKEADSADFGLDALCDRSLDRTIIIPPEGVIIGLEFRQKLTNGCSSSSVIPISRAPIDFRAPTDPPYPSKREVVHPCDYFTLTKYRRLRFLSTIRR